MIVRENLWSGPPPGRRIHPSARLAHDVEVHEWTTILDRVIVGAETKIGRCVFIDRDVVIGSRCKIQNDAQLYRHAYLGTGVFIGPRVLLLNDRHPRAINESGELAEEGKDWEPASVHVLDGASIGAGAILMPGITVGPFATVGAGALVLANVSARETVCGVWKGDRHGLRRTRLR